MKLNKIFLNALFAHLTWVAMNVERYKRSSMVEYNKKSLAIIIDLNNKVG